MYSVILFDVVHMLSNYILTGGYATKVPTGDADVSQHVRVRCKYLFVFLVFRTSSGMPERGSTKHSRSLGRAAMARMAIVYPRLSKQWIFL